MKIPELFPKSASRFLLVAWAAFAPIIAHAGAFTAGDLAVVAAAGSGNNTNCFVVEINTVTASQPAIQTIPIDATTNRVSGSATSTLYASDSNDGTLFCFTVHNSATTSANANTLNPRGVVTLDASGNYVLQTTYTGASGNQTRGACTVNDATWFIGDQGGFYSNGTTTASPTGNIRSVKAFGGTVYAFTSSAALAPVGIISSAVGGTYTALPGLAAGATSRQDLYLVSSGSNGSTYDVLYVLDATSGTAGTIFKYSLVSGSWTANGTYATSFGGFGLCAAGSGSGAVLYVTTGTGASINNSVMKLTDTAGYNATIAITTANNVTLYTAASGAILKGIAFAPVSAVAIDNTGSPAAGSLILGNVDVPLFGFRLTPAGSTDFTGLKLTTAGTATISDLSNFRVIYDVDNSGTYNAGDSVVSSSAQSLANPINFTITGQTGFSAARRYLVVADVAAGAAVGHTFTGSIAASSDVITSIAASGTAAGNLQTIAAAVSDLTMTTVSSSESATISSLINDATISTASQGAQVWQVVVSNPTGNAGAAMITALNILQGANNGVANWQNTIQAAELFDGSTALGAGTISATGIAFSGLSLNVADGSSKTLSLRISLKSTAGALVDNSKFQFALAGTDVTVTGNGMTTTAINSDQTQNAISVVATKLVFASVPATVVTNTPFTAIVLAEDANGNLDLDNATSVAITLASGAGVLSGGGALPLSAGSNRWASLSYDSAGTFSLQAAGGTLTAATSSSILAALLPAASDVFMPQYMQGIASGSSNGKRVPLACRVTIANLIANATYRYYNQGVVGSDGATSSGAGNCIIATPSGDFLRTSSPGLSTAGSYGTFTADGTGNYTGWFLLEPTGNTRFTAGNQVFIRILLNDGANGTSVAARVTTTESAAVLAFNTTGANTGTGIRGNSSATDKNFVLLYDNVAGTGRPLAATFVESDGVAENAAASYVPFYTNSVDGVSGAWGTIIPNDNANGIRRIEQRKLSDGSLVAANTDSDGTWPSGAVTVNPAGGDATPIVITATDAPLTGAVTTPVVTAINVVGGNVQIDFTGGTSDGVGDFSVVGSTNLPTAMTSVSATITSSGPGVFRATMPATAPAAFYRIQR